MSLHTVADGILDTHVTWQDILSAMQKAFKTEATFGNNRKVTNIGDMKGLLSRIGLVETDWENSNVDKNLPDSFIVKIPSQLPMMDMMKVLNLSVDEFYANGKLETMANLTRMMHNREVSTYKMLAEEKNPKIPVTKVYASKAFDEQNKLKGYIISEYIPNLVHMAMHESIPYQDLIPVVKSAATFSEIGEKLNRKDLAFAGKHTFLDIMEESVYDEKTQEQTQTMLRKAFPKEFESKVEKMIQIYKDFYMKKAFLSKYKNVSVFLGYRDVLTHSDLWGSNILCTRNNGKVNLEAIIDWQTVSFTTPAQDVGRLFVACLSKKDRREKLEELLELYYNSFLKELDGKPAPYTFQQLRDSYNLFFPMMVILVLPGIAPLLDHADIPEEYREIVQTSALDKMIGMLEDVLEIHESNVQRFPEFYKF